jgi:glyoxylase-like metal-dependent hydrolase (beta-lactamase superfamily II)
MERTSPITHTVNRWQVGHVRITRVIEHEGGGFPPTLMFANLTQECVQSVEWLHPHYADPDGSLRYSVHSYIVESQGHRIIVDTCVGNDKPRVSEGWNQMHGPFLERLAEAGFPPESIDIVLCTHMHIDHVGWNTRWLNGKWVPTFPNARYLFGRLEWDHWNNEQHGSGDVPPPIAALLETDVVVGDSVTPIVEAGLHQLVETDHRINDEISLFPTPGHTPGHVSVAIHSDGDRAVIAGDIMHNPIQLADPGICSNFDTDRALAQTTRTSFIKSHADRDVLVLGTHFPTPSVGRIVQEVEGWRFAPADDPQA